MPVASLCSQAASNSIITLFRVSDQRYRQKKKKTAFLDSRILPKKSNSLNLFKVKKYGTIDQSGIPRPDTACLVHHWLSSFNLSFNLPPPTWPCIYIQDHASSFISVLSLVHYPDEYQAYCPRWIIHIRCQSMDHYLLTAQEARENLLLLLRYTTPTVLLLYNNLSNDCVSSGRGLLHWGMGASRTGYPDPSSHKTRNIWQVSNHEGV